MTKRLKRKGKRHRKPKVAKVKRYSDQEIAAAQLLIRAIDFAQIPDDKTPSVEALERARQALSPSFTPNQLNEPLPKPEVWQHKHAKEAERLFKDIIAADFHGIALEVDESLFPWPGPGQRSEYEAEVKLALWKHNLRETVTEAVDGLSGKRTQLVSLSERQTIPAELQSLFLVGPIHAAASISPSRPMLTLIGDVNSLIQIQVVTLLRFVGVERLKRCRCQRIFLYHRHGGRRDFCSPRCQRRFHRKDHPPLPTKGRNKK